MLKSRVLRAAIRSVNAYSGAFVGVAVEADTAATVAKKFAAACAAQPAWAAAGFEHRKDCVTKFQALLAANVDELAGLLSAEMGKPVAHAKGEINSTGPRIQYFMDMMEDWVCPMMVAKASSGTLELLHAEPLGVVANVSAWNYPYFVGSNVWVPGLLAGNAVLYKPSEWALQTGRRVSELMAEAGVPEAVFCPVYGGADAGAALAAQPLDGLFFTGSCATGRKITAAVYSEQAMAARMQTRPRSLFPRLQLELGGKDPVYVADDAKDPTSVGEGVADGAFFNAGQSCCAVERIYAHEKVYDAVVKGVVQYAQSLTVGDPSQEGTYLGPLARPSQPAYLQAQVDDAVAKGATVLCGGTRAGLPSDRFYPPTVLANVTHAMDVMVDESFGPVVGIMKVSSDDEAVAKMNDTKYGLTAAVFSSNRQRAEAILQQVNSGTAYVNACDRVSPFSPWSGRGASGFGSTLGPHGIAAFLQPKAYHIR